MGKLKTLLIIPIIASAVSFILPFVYWPEMLNWPFFMQNGWLPYRDFAIIHTPILPVLLLIYYKIFGFYSNNLHMFGTLNLFVTGLILGSFFDKPKKAIFAQAIYYLLAFAFDGNTVWFEILVTPFLLLLVKVTPKKPFVFGVLLGILILIKQTSAYIFLPILVWVIIKRGNLVRIFFGFTVVIFLFGLVLTKLEMLTDFWRWGVMYVFAKPFEIGGENSYVVYPSLKQTLFLLTFLVLAFWYLLKSKTSNTLVLALLIPFSFLFALPRFEYFHLQPMIGLIALGIGFAGFQKKIFFIAVLALILLRQNVYYDHDFLNGNVVAQKDIITKKYQNESLFVLNGEEQVYFLTNKMPAVKPWIPQLPWYLVYYGQQFMADIKKANPQVVLWYPYKERADRGVGAYQPTDVVDYINNNYRQVFVFNDGTMVLEKI